MSPRCFGVDDQPEKSPWDSRTRRSSSTISSGLIGALGPRTFALRWRRVSLCLHVTVSSREAERLLHAPSRLAAGLLRLRSLQDGHDTPPSLQAALDPF